MYTKCWDSTSPSSTLLPEHWQSLDLYSSGGRSNSSLGNSSLLWLSQDKDLKTLTTGISATNDVFKSVHRETQSQQCPISCSSFPSTLQLVIRNRQQRMISHVWKSLWRERHRSKQSNSKHKQRTEKNKTSHVEEILQEEEKITHSKNKNRRLFINETIKGEFSGGKTSCSKGSHKAQTSSYKTAKSWDVPRSMAATVSAAGLTHESCWERKSEKFSSQGTKLCDHV